MATNLDKVLENFYWRIGATAPTYSGSARTVGRFREWDPEGGTDPSKGTGWTRRFWVEWRDSGEDADAAAVMRESDHVFRVHVLYPRRQGSHRRTQAMIAQDRHDLIKTLRGQIRVDHRLGYDDDHSTADIGLMRRKRMGDELRPFPGNNKVYQFSTDWLCSVREDET